MAVVFTKWRKWRDRLQGEFLELLIQQFHFHELEAVTKPYIGTETGSELARSMAQSYAAFAFTGIRRMAEFPKSKTQKSKEIVSLPTWLEDIQANAQLVTRARQRRRYKKAMKHLPARVYTAAADRVHDAVTRGADVLQAAMLESDLKLIERTARRISKVTDKVYAHIERDRRRIPRGFRLGKADEAISILLEILKKYSLCIFGDSLSFPQLEDVSVADDLRKVWPGG